jgi:hypothetical protein
MAANLIDVINGKMAADPPYRMPEFVPGQWLTDKKIGRKLRELGFTIIKDPRDGRLRVGPINPLGSPAEQVEDEEDLKEFEIKLDGKTVDQRNLGRKDFVRALTQLAASQPGYKPPPAPTYPPGAIVVARDVDGETACRPLRLHPAEFTPVTVAIAQATPKLLALLPPLKPDELLPDKDLGPCVVLGGCEQFTEDYTASAPPTWQYDDEKQVEVFDANSETFRTVQGAWVQKPSTNWSFQSRRESFRPHEYYEKPEKIVEHTKAFAKGARLLRILRDTAGYLVEQEMAKQKEEVLT